MMSTAPQPNIVPQLTSGMTKSKTIPDDRKVYAISPNVDAVFFQDVWDLSPAESGSRSAGALTIDFSYISHNKPAFRVMAKELAYFRLNEKLSPSVKVLSPYTCCREQVRLKRFLRWIDAYHPDIISPVQITQSVIHAYRKWIESHKADDALENIAGGNTRADEGVSPETVWTYMSPLKSLDLYRDYLSEPMPFSPYDGKMSASFFGVDSSNTTNKTSVIADDVLHPMVTVSLRYIDQYVDDIRSMVNERIEFWENPENNFSGTGIRSEFPGWKTVISVCSALGMPWRPPLGSEGYHANHEFRTEMGHFISACATIIMYLSGMRPYEICALKKDCLIPVKDSVTGTVFRWKVRGLPAKKRKRAGKKLRLVDWVVPEHAARAIIALQEILDPFRKRLGSDQLILNLDAFMQKVDRIDVNKDGMDDRSLGTRMKHYLRVIAERYGYEISNSIKPSQFRRTLARHIARQPFGIIAGKLQYHHVKTAVFEGYAGGEDDGFRLEVADEELMRNIDLLEEIRQDARDGCVFGPGALSLIRDYDAAKAADIGAAMVDATPGEMVVGAAVKAVAKRVHAGTLNYCVFGTAKALCLTEEEAAEKDAEPRINMCAPDKCGCSVVGKCHVPVWQSLLDDVKALEKQAKTGPQKESLKKESVRYERIIESGISA